MEDLYWLLPLGLFLALFLSNRLQGALGGFRAVPPAEAERLAREEKAWLLDVREVAEWRQGRIPGARHLPLGQLAARLAELEGLRPRPVVVYCQSGMRSAAAARTLKSKGFDPVYNLSGGLLAWRASGRKVEAG